MIFIIAFFVVACVSTTCPPLGKDEVVDIKTFDVGYDSTDERMKIGVTWDHYEGNNVIISLTHPNGNDCYFSSAEPILRPLEYWSGTMNVCERTQRFEMPIGEFIECNGVYDTTLGNNRLLNFQVFMTIRGEKVINDGTAEYKLPFSQMQDEDYEMSVPISMEFNNVEITVLSTLDYFRSMAVSQVVYDTDDNGVEVRVVVDYVMLYPTGGIFDQLVITPVPIPCVSANGDLSCTLLFLHTETVTTDVAGEEKTFYVRTYRMTIIGQNCDGFAPSDFTIDFNVENPIEQINEDYTVALYVGMSDICHQLYEFGLTGSMNFVGNGVARLRESIHFQISLGAELAFLNPDGVVLSEVSILNYADNAVLRVLKQTNVVLAGGTAMSYADDVTYSNSDNSATVDFSFMFGDDLGEDGLYATIQNAANNGRCRIHAVVDLSYASLQKRRAFVSDSFPLNSVVTLGGAAAESKVNIVTIASIAAAVVVVVSLLVVAVVAAAITFVCFKVRSSKKVDQEDKCELEMDQC